MFLLDKKNLIGACVMILACAPGVLSQTSDGVRQPQEVFDAYSVCERFQTLLAEDLDFGRAFEATFAKNPSRRREIAIAEGEFSDVDLAKIDDAALIGAFKSRMQMFCLMMPLMGPDTQEEEELFFPARLKAIFERKPPKAANQFRAYALQLKKGAADFRAHLNQLAAHYPRVTQRIRKFKYELSRKPIPPPYVVKPLSGYSRGRVLGPNEEYYQIGDYAVTREGNEMRIIGIRFFSRLF